MEVATRSMVLGAPGKTGQHSRAVIRKRHKKKKKRLSAETRTAGGTCVRGLQRCWGDTGAKISYESWGLPRFMNASRFDLNRMSGVPSFLIGPGAVAYDAALPLLGCHDA